jgi:hypothetical protein
LHFQAIPEQIVLKNGRSDKCLWSVLVILAIQKAEIRRITVPSQHRQIVARPFLKKPISKGGVVEWLKVKAPCSIPSTTKKVGGENSGDGGGSISSWDRENFPDISSLGF